MSKPLLSAALALLTLTACDPAALVSAAGALDPNAPKVRVTGRIYAPADQVAVITAGSGNVITPGGGNVITAGGGNLISQSFGLLARADEKGVGGAKVSFSLFGGLLPAGTTQTDDVGNFKLDVPAGATYTATATCQAKNGGSVTLTGLTVVSASGGSLELDVAHNLVASKLLTLGAKKIDAGKLSQAVSEMESDLQSQSRAPMPNNMAEAAAEFDRCASQECKDEVAAMAK